MLYLCEEDSEWGGECFQNRKKNPFESQKLETATHRANNAHLIHTHAQTHTSQTHKLINIYYWNVMTTMANKLLEEIFEYISGRKFTTNCCRFRVRIDSFQIVGQLL